MYVPCSRKLILPRFFSDNEKTSAYSFNKCSSLSIASVGSTHSTTILSLNARSHFFSPLVPSPSQSPEQHINHQLLGIHSKCGCVLTFTTPTGVRLAVSPTTTRPAYFIGATSEVSVIQSAAVAANLPYNVLDGTSH